jgi:hypothetical protein
MKLNSVLKRRNCKSYKEFRKIERKYFKYFDAWRCKHWKQFYQRLKCLYYVWIEYEFTDLEELKRFQKYVNKPFSKVDINLRGIVNKVVDNFGKEFKAGKLTGFSITNEDYYWIYTKPDGNRLFGSCVGKLE